MGQLEQAAVVRRITEKDAGLWKSNGTVEKEIRDRLGWLRVADRMEERVPELDELRAQLVAEGFTDAVLMGMGGSSLAPEVFRQTFGAPKGALNVHVLDTTDPAAIAAVEQSIDVKKTAFIVAPAPLRSFGIWAEQLIAESTGKEGKGLVPVADEALGSPEVYGNDRLFVRLALPGGDDGDAARLEALGKAGHPVLTLKLNDPLSLGAEFFRWEYAIAVAGAILGINVFDQPNVQEAKDLTRKVLSEGNPPTVGEGIRWAGQQGATLDAAVQSLLG